MGAPVGSVLLGNKNLITQGQESKESFWRRNEAGRLFRQLQEFMLWNIILKDLNRSFSCKQIAEALLKKDFTGKNDAG